MKVIEVNNLVKKYNDFTAVNNINFSVDEGEVFGFLGPNGAGKSTTIKILSTLLTLTSGKAYLNGYDVQKEPNKVRSSIGLVFQETTLDERLTAKENLVFHAMLYGIPKKIYQKRLQQVLEIVELTDRVDTLVKTFSGGMKRRLEIARGLLHYPKVIFLDEPTVGLDLQTRSRIWEYIHQLRKTEGVTIFLTTHYMDEAENCNRIAIIDNGKIVALNTPEKLKERVSGDIVTMASADNNRLYKRLINEFGLEAEMIKDGVQVETAKGETFIPQLISKLPNEITYISLRKPTLNDVFLKLTGREIREELLDGKEIMRARLGRRSRFK
ncbi:MAG: ABC transporter ATP-binding protein [Peptococcaceae bacterium BICA1-8]|nr:MAG: ABC transporter ATP-binding protein [Peptococcaceae bacterium BICA1-8]